MTVGAVCRCWRIRRYPQRTVDFTRGHARAARIIAIERYL
jgi:hypothetical protein